MPRSKSKSRKKATPKLSKIRSIFDSLDVDANGNLSLEELQTHFERSSALNHDQLQDLLDSADVDGDGNIDYDEFERIFTHMNSDGSVVQLNSNQLQLWDSFQDSLFHKEFELVRHISETVILTPLQTYIKKKSIDRELAPKFGKKHRTAPRFVRCGAESFDCCCFLPLMTVLLMLICSPFLYYFTDDIYRAGKDVLCHNQIPQRIVNTMYETEDAIPANAAIHKWCDPNGNCPELFGMLGLNATETETDATYPSKSIVRRSYRVHAKTYHPDKACAGKVEEDFKECEEKYNRLFQCLADAKETLMDPEKRTYYLANDYLDTVEIFMAERTWEFLALGGGVIAFFLAIFSLLSFRICICQSRGPGKYCLGINVVDNKGADATRCIMCQRSLLKIFFYLSVPIYFFGLWFLQQMIAFDNEMALALAVAIIILPYQLYQHMNHHVVFQQ